MIKAFDPQNLKNVRADIDSALLAIKQKYGITIQLGNISYSPDKATSRLTMIAVGDAAAATDPRAAALAKAQAEFKRAASSFGLKPEQFGATFTFGRDTYKLAGLKPRSPKRPVLGTSLRDGKTYVFPESAIAPLQSKEHKETFGIVDSPATGSNVSCSNTSAFDEKFKPIGKCNRTATTSRKGYGRNSRPLPYCEQCARLIDESRAEMAAEARCS
jgi:hypothetical protein